MLDTSPAAPSLTPQETHYKKKLIEVALPLQAINAASAREKSIRHGHPSTLHLWWARRPLAACRAVLFASLVDDPSSDPERFPTPEDQERERKRLFDLIEQLVKWENSLNEHVLAQARKEIQKFSDGELPSVYDPFCGGGAIPIEAQRLGLPTLASDLNPVAVLITKALTEIPWRFKGYAPVHPSLVGPLQAHTYERATGLAADVRAYGKWLLKQARERIGQYYPTAVNDGRQATVIAWLWARTVQCPNPLCGAQMPLIKSFVLSTKQGKERSIEPKVDPQRKTVSYETREGKPSRDGTITRRGAVCIVCHEPVNLKYIQAEGKAGRMGAQMIAIVADGGGGRVYLAPSEEQEHLARSAKPTWAPHEPMSTHSQYMGPPRYGMDTFDKLFTSRQLLALTTFSDLVRECRAQVFADAIAAGLRDDGKPLESGGCAATAYADAIATYLALAVDRLADYSSSLSSWIAPREIMRGTMTGQRIAMVWDYAEVNPFSASSGNFGGAVDWVVKCVAAAAPTCSASVSLRDAADGQAYPRGVFSTDPPYYDNVPYADLSDYFYVWLRASLGDVFPTELATLLVPKARELVADTTRFAGKAEARGFFEHGLTEVFTEMRSATIEAAPMTVFYAFKQADQGAEKGENEQSQERASVGWEAMLAALLGAGCQITGTWPMTSEFGGRARSINSNALASSIVLVSRPRPKAADKCTRARFIRELRGEMPEAVRRLKDASLAATDLEQAAIGPGMAIFSRYNEVLENDGTSMSVRSALALINEELAQILLGEVADVDAETHFALAWFDGHFYTPGKYGEADVLLKAKNASLDPLHDARVIESGRGTVQLIAPRSISPDDIEATNGGIQEMPAWAQTMQIIAALVGENGSEEAAADVLHAIGVATAERLKGIAYHCYLVCERAKRSNEAQDFNALVAAWPELTRLAEERGDFTLF